MKSSKDERRNTKRLACGIKVRAYRVDKETSRLLNAYILDTKDITPKGLFLNTPKVLPVNTELNLELILSPDTPAISAEGKVAWIAVPEQRSYYPGMGIKIMKIKRGEGRRLKDFLKEKFRNYHHAVELKRMYIQLKEMGARLYELEELHPHAEHFRKAIDNTIEEINHIAHIIDKEVWEIKRL